MDSEVSADRFLLSLLAGMGNFLLGTILAVRNSEFKTFIQILSNLIRSPCPEFSRIRLGLKKVDS